MRKFLTHEIIVVFWVLITYFLAVLNIPGVSVNREYVWTGYCFVVIWFFMAWRRNDVINTCVKLIATIGMLLFFLLSYAATTDFINLHELPNVTTPRYILISYLLGHEFIVVFIASLLVSPLIIFLFSKNNHIVMALIVSFPTFCIKPFFNFHSISKASYTIGIYSTRTLAVIVATYFSSVILHHFIKNGMPNKGVVPDAAKE